jgi:hypothetical protein
MIESELREMLRARAAAFPSPPLVPAVVLRRAKARRARHVAALALVALGLSAASAAAFRMTPDQRAFAAFILVDQNQVGTGEKPAPAHPREASGEPLTRARLEQHARCMRAHGVNVPDPQITPEGWTILVKDPPFRSDKAFRRALFVDCRLLNVTENLVLGGRSRAYIDNLMACTRKRGFVLPPPTEESSGQFQFDLNKTTPAWGSDAWYRVVFLTCAGPLPAPRDAARTRRSGLS